MRTEYDIIFVVLVYRNTDDLVSFFKSLNVDNSKVVVVNSFYDDESESIFKRMAQENDAAFISVPNNGYGAGNNRGIEYALSNYSFRYLIVSNADILIDKLSIEILEKEGEAIIAPKIINLNNKNQNPSTPFTPSLITWKIWKLLYEKEMRRLYWGMFVISRFKKLLFYLISPWHKRIFSAHGAFVIFPVKVLKQLIPIYNEQMFLFVEEEHLGMLAKKKGVKTVYAPDIIIRHKEDGSMTVASVNQFDRMRQSFLVFYNYWFHN